MTQVLMKRPTADETINLSVQERGQLEILRVHDG